METGQIVGVDVGGTFTDFIILGAEGTLTVRKRASTPADPSESILQGLRDAQNEGLLTSGFTLAHGTTVATNALLERRGAKTVLFTTAGFRDVLEIGRQSRDTLYTFHPTKPAPLLPRAARRELTERVDWQGTTLIALDAAEVEAALDRLLAEGVESVAVCFLFSYLNPVHEQLVGAAARRRGLSISLSCEVAPEPREYERTGTTVANALVAPVMARYLRRLEIQAAETGAAKLRVMQSNGGALSTQEASERAIATALSGPAAGVVAAARCGEAAGFTRLLTFDMGGTSTDVALIVNGQCPLVTTARVAGTPLCTPMLDIHTVGAGGGSLATLDAAGGLRVGPQSAGAEPGPVAYGKGETLTVTDANLQLGRLPANIRLGERLSLDAARVHAHFKAFASRLGCSPEEAALGIVRVANVAMARALRHISVERGVDPADYTLLSFGGAGGLHACALAESLGMQSVLVPCYPGAFSALGLVYADIRREVAQALPITGAKDWGSSGIRDEYAARFRALEAQAAVNMAKEGLAAEDWQGQRLLDLRYVGQSFSLRVPVRGDLDLPATVEAFHLAHRERYGHADPGESVEAVALRILAVGGQNRANIRPTLPASPGSPLGETQTYAAVGWETSRLYGRSELCAGQEIIGPAIILQVDATTYLPISWTAQVLHEGSLHLKCR